jgi:hypothetical protein
MKTALICLSLLVAVPFTLAQQPAASPPQKTISSYMGLHTFPAKNQTAAEQQKDEMGCYEWAKQDSGFDPLAALIAEKQASAPISTEPTAPKTGGAGADMKGAAVGAAGGAATGAVVGAIAGNAGKGAAAGAVVGGPLGLAMAKRAQIQAQKQAQKQAQQQQEQQAQRQAQAKAEMQQKLDGFKKGFSACMEAKNYVVK